MGALIICSCKKSTEAEYDAFAKKTAELVASSATNWLATNKVNFQTSNQVSDMARIYKQTVKSDVAKEASINIAEAGQFLLQLHDSERLPGVSKDEHGEIESEVVPVMVSNKLVLVSYPMECLFHIVKYGYTSTNNFIVLKESKEAEWKLQRAWKTDSNGQIIQEWPVK